jgi:hypothetical protein
MPQAILTIGMKKTPLISSNSDLFYAKRDISRLETAASLLGMYLMSVKTNGKKPSPSSLNSCNGTIEIMYFY